MQKRFASHAAALNPPLGKNPYPQATPRRTPGGPQADPCLLRLPFTAYYCTLRYIIPQLLHNTAYYCILLQPTPLVSAISQASVPLKPY